MKVTLLKSVTYGVPVLDKSKKPVIAKTKFNNREVEYEVNDFVNADAGEVVDVSKKVAEEWIEAGHARAFEAALDDVDPTDALS